MKKSPIYFVLIGITILSILVLNTSIIRFPVNLAQKLVNIKVSASYVPVSYEKTYSTIRNCGRNCSVINIHYVGSNDHLVITVTNNVSHSDDSRWDEKTKLSGTPYYYREDDKKQMLFWKQEKWELTIEYSGKEGLQREELIKTAKSISVNRKNY